jgi:SAM-dependent methyltransferase
MSERAHSEPYLGDQRDFFWNPDFLELLARRLERARVRDFLDVGCGMGHFTKALQPHLSPGARVAGVDRESRWVREAAERLRARSPQTRGAYLRGDVLALPFAESSFDAAVCQTLLIHVRDPAAAVAEMMRVVKPGGLVLAAEPNNLFGSLSWCETTRERSPQDLALVMEAWLTLYRGEEALGQGDLAAGERLPGIFARARLENVRAYLSDRAYVFLPPYDTPAERADLAAARAWRERAEGPWDLAELRAWFDAGGGRPGVLERFLELQDRWWLEDEAARAAGTYSSAGGAVFYVVAGRRPG